MYGTNRSGNHGSVRAGPRVNYFDNIEKYKNVRIVTAQTIPRISFYILSFDIQCDSEGQTVLISSERDISRGVGRSSELFCARNLFFFNAL